MPPPQIQAFRQFGEKLSFDGAEFGIWW